MIDVEIGVWRGKGLHVYSDFSKTGILRLLVPDEDYERDFPRGLASIRIFNDGKCWLFAPDVLIYRNEPAAAETRILTIVFLSHIDTYWEPVNTETTEKPLHPDENK